MPDQELGWESLSERSKLIIRVAFLVLFGICIFLWLSSDSGGFSFPSDVIDHKVLTVNGAAELEVTLKLPEFNGAAPGSVFAASSQIVDVVKHEVKQGQGETQIVFHIVEDTGGGYDMYGRAQPKHLAGAFDIGYSMDQARLIDWDTVGGNGRWLLDLGSVSNVTAAGSDAIRKYCEDDGFKQYARVFCAGY